MTTRQIPINIKDIGTATITVTADGPIEDRDKVIDYMCGVAAKALEMKAAEISFSSTGKSSGNERFDVKTTSGKVSYSLSIEFDLQSELSWRDHNTLTSSAHHRLVDAASACLGDAEDAQQEIATYGEFWAMVARSDEITIPEVAMAGSSSSGRMGDQPNGGYGTDPGISQR